MDLKPFAAVVLAVADKPPQAARRDSSGINGQTGGCDPPPPAYVYANKMLLYMVGRTLRMLALHGGATTRYEKVIDVRSLLDKAILESKGTCNYHFQPLHYSDGIVSCVYAHHRRDRNQESWLVLLNPETQWCTSHRLALPHHRLFVRNNKHHLVFGTFTRRRVPEQDTEIAGLGTGAETSAGAAARSVLMSRQRRWVLRHYSFADNTWSAKAIFLNNSIGLSEIGSSLCFEFIDDYFYALANQQRYLDDSEYDYDDNDELNPGANSIGNTEASPTDLNDPRLYIGMPAPRPADQSASSSYYTCVRFPISNPSIRETPTRESLWRRRNDEGALDDRWTTLRLEKCQATGQIIAVESRKEWLHGSGSSGSRRTYYTQPFVWESTKHDEGESSSSSSNNNNGMTGEVRKAQNFLSMFIQAMTLRA
ncbi:MAG: hypothetical protein STHCBS139747_007534 [Sporothrix thermara]